MQAHRVIDHTHDRQVRKNRAPLHALMLFIGALTGCGIPEPGSTEAQRDALQRGDVTIKGETPFRLSYLKAGDPEGQRVIFVHGTPGEAGAWADYLVNVPAGFEYIAVDRPGFGQSGPEAAVTDLKDQAAALLPLLETQGGAKPVLVGHSLGGPIVARAALDFPDRIAGIMIVAGSLDPGLEEIHFMQHVGDSWPLRPLLPRKIRNSNHELLALEPHLADMQTRLSEITMPVKIVHGTEDDLVPFENVAFMRDHLINAPLDLTELTGRNHFLPWHSKNELDAALARLIKATKAGHFTKN